MPASLHDPHVPAACHLVFSFTCNNTNYTDSAPVVPQTAPVPHDFSTEPLRFRTGSSNLCLCCPRALRFHTTSIPNRTASAPLFTPTAPVSHRLPKPFPLPPQSPLIPPLFHQPPHRFRTTFPSNCPASAPLPAKPLRICTYFPNPCLYCPGALRFCTGFTQYCPGSAPVSPQPHRFCTTLPQPTPKTENRTNR